MNTEALRAELAQVSQQDSILRVAPAQHKHRWVDSTDPDPRLPFTWYQQCSICQCWQEDGHGRYVGDYGPNPI